MCKGEVWIRRQSKRKVANSVGKTSGEGERVRGVPAAALLLPVVDDDTVTVAAAAVEDVEDDVQHCSTTCISAGMKGSMNDGSKSAKHSNNSTVPRISAGFPEALAKFCCKIVWILP